MKLLVTTVESPLPCSGLRNSGCVFLYVVAPVLWCGCLPRVCDICVCISSSVCSLRCVYVCSCVLVGRIGGSCLLIRVVKDGDCICVVKQLCDDNRKTHLFHFPCSVIGVIVCSGGVCVLQFVYELSA